MVYGARSREWRTNQGARAGDCERTRRRERSRTREHTEAQGSVNGRALSKWAATSGQLTRFQNASTQSPFTFLYCR